jgi:hypothetical protein
VRRLFVALTVGLVVGAIRGSKSRSYRSPNYSTTDSAIWLFKAVP